MASKGMMFTLPYPRVGKLEMEVTDRQTDTWWPHLTLFLLQEGKQANKRTPKLIPFRLCSQVLHTPAPRPSTSIARGCRRPAVSQVLPSARIRTASILCLLTERWLHHVANFNPLNPELNPICYLLALLGAHHFLHVSRIRVKLSTFTRLMSYIYIYIYIYIYEAPILDVSRSHTTTQHSR